MFASLQAWLSEQGIACQANVSIGPHLYFKIGGRVSLLVVCASPVQRAACLQKIVAEKVPYLVIGGGSNIAFSDDLTQAVVLLMQTEGAPEGPVRLLDRQTLHVDAGVRNQALLSWCVGHGAGGLEFLSGIPGTIGGAAAVNAGAFGNSMADVLLGADIVDETGRLRTVDAGYFAFAYRDSRFKFGNEVILSLHLKFCEREAEVISKKIRENLDYRSRRHPSYRYPSAGCFFKNPCLANGRKSAGQLIEACGLKNRTVGGLTVAQVHANFILNIGRATFQDLLRLENEIKTTVATATSVKLEREVIYVAADGKKY